MSISDQKHIKEYLEGVEYLESFENISREQTYWDGNLNEMFLERMKYFLNLLNLDLSTLKVIHISGTAGKGTLAHTIHKALTFSGKKSGLFTSPFTISTIEYFQVGLKYINIKKFNKILEFLKPKIDYAYANSPFGGPSYFEIITCMALIYFIEKNCEYAVIEVGMGGRYDSTNVFNKKLISAITNIGLDHTEVLGKDLSSIANNKAGIIKGSEVFFTQEHSQDLQKVLKDECKLFKVKFKYVKENIAQSICEYLKIPQKYYVKAVNSLNIPCRFETISKEPIIVLDGAHNNVKFEYLLNKLEMIKDLKLSLIFGVNSRKDYRQFLQRILRYNPTIYLTRFEKAYSSNIKATNPTEIHQYLKDIGYPSEIFLDNKRALKSAINHTEKGEVILVTGSFFLCRELRNVVLPEIQMLRKNI